MLTSCAHAILAHVSQACVTIVPPLEMALSKRPSMSPLKTGARTACFAAASLEASASLAKPSERTVFNFLIPSFDIEILYVRTVNEG
jgi:hypothetical protein